MAWDAIVVGGGCAGLAYATRASESGRKVLVLERKPYLGGRASSHRDPSTQEILDNGQHLLLGCYDETQIYLRRIGALDRLRFWERFQTPLLGPDGSRAVLRTGALPAPLHTLVGILGLTSLSVRERLGIIRVALAARLWGNDRLRGIDVSSWLRALGQTPRAIERFWEPLVLATLNADPSLVSADQLAVVLVRGFMASRPASRIALSTVGLTELLGEPSRAFLHAAGSEVRTRARVGGFLFDRDRIVGVATESGETLRSERVVAAIPPDALWAMAKEAPSSLRDRLEPIRALRPSPILSLHLWSPDLDLLDPWIGLWGTSFHWLFHRARFLDVPGTRHVTLVLSAADRAMRLSKDEIVSLAKRELSAALGKNVCVERAVLIKEPFATWIAPIGDTRARLAPGPIFPGLSICGDWTQTGLPGTIESAIASGHAVAMDV